MEKILVRDPKKRININGIKKHPFYLKGKKIFGDKHKEYMKELERPIMRKIISSYIINGLISKNHNMIKIYNSKTITFKIP